MVNKCARGYHFEAKSNLNNAQPVFLILLSSVCTWSSFIDFVHYWGARWWRRSLWILDEHVHRDWRGAQSPLSGIPGCLEYCVPFLVVLRVLAWVGHVTGQVCYWAVPRNPGGDSTLFHVVLESFPLTPQSVHHARSCKKRYIWQWIILQRKCK